jgi:hypothetical protein
MRPFFKVTNKVRFLVVMGAKFIGTFGNFPFPMGGPAIFSGIACACAARKLRGLRGATFLPSLAKVRCVRLASRADYGGSTSLASPSLYGTSHQDVTANHSKQRRTITSHDKITTKSRTALYDSVRLISRHSARIVEVAKERDTRG